MAIEYRVLCDGCGTPTGTSNLSARAARADMCRRGGNHGPDGDYCQKCRLKRIAAIDEQIKARNQERAKLPREGRFGNWG